MSLAPGGRLGPYEIVAPLVLEDVTASPTEAAPLTGKGTILGTISYMAPEQLEGESADARTDIWALGAIVYEMVAGRRAFEGSSQVSLIAAIVERGPAAASARACRHAHPADPELDGGIGG